MRLFGSPRIEYSFSMNTCNLGSKTRTGINPFTGEKVIFHIDNGLTEMEAALIKETLARLKFNGPEPEGEGYALYFGFRESIRFRCHEVGLGFLGFVVEVITRNLSDKILKILMEIADVGNFVIMTSIGDEVRYINREPTKEMKERWPKIGVITSAFELKAWLDVNVKGREIKFFS